MKTIIWRGCWVPHNRIFIYAKTYLLVLIYVLIYINEHHHRSIKILPQKTGHEAV